MARILLRLYPRRIRQRYGDELLNLGKELRARDGVSDARLVWDLLAGALIVRRARERVLLVVLAGLAIVAVASPASLLTGPAGSSPIHAALHPGRCRVHIALPYLSGKPCFVGVGSPCSLSACTEFAGHQSLKGASIYRMLRAARPHPRLTHPRCAAYPHLQPQRPEFVRGEPGVPRTPTADPHPPTLAAPNEAGRSV